MEPFLKRQVRQTLRVTSKLRGQVSQFHRLSEAMASVNASLVTTPVRAVGLLALFTLLRRELLK